MPIKIKRWNDPRESDDGLRILVCRYRPRALPKSAETWDVWEKQLGPSKELHAAIYGKHEAPIPWELFRERYLQEMQEQTEAVRKLAQQVQDGETITLLCSSACVEESRCHRSLLKALIEENLK